MKPANRNVRKEVRFAVVMYGGVSLAIYINGVVQELFRMVRATATKEDDESPLVPYNELCGSECVYRQLGQMLESEGGEWGGLCSPEDPIRTRFVVDILSGSSAGGINAIYLAKALANGQNVNQLSKLWEDEGDIGKLINDKESVKQLDGLKPQNPPKSLLNGQRMYRKLLDALDGMDDPDNPRPPDAKSPFVKELDLFVTATDFYGLPVPLRLFGSLVEERRYRNVYQLRYSELGNEVRNDFRRETNSFLAFAARSTSAFPFAFDPIKPTDTNAILKTVPKHRQDVGHDRERWQRFFPAYQCPSSEVETEECDFTNRPFVDGGYLDNKPFSYAIDALAWRDSEVPVDRKLFYIEPSPEHIEDRGRYGEVPNAIENAAAALSSLPRYEPIREDLQRILYRNRLLERVKTITSKMEEDLYDRQLVEHKPRGSEDFGKGDLRRMIETEGVAYGGYHRLKVSAVSEEITEMIARAAGFDTESDEFFAIRYLVEAWRKENYTTYSERNKATENAFLVRYDLSYRIRRINFVIDKIGQLYPLDEEAKEILKQLDIREPTTDDEKEAFRNELTKLRTELNEVLVTLQSTREKLKSPDSKNPLIGAIEDMGLSRDVLRTLLEKSAKERPREAKRLVCSLEMSDAFWNLASTLAENIAGPTRRAATNCKKILGAQRPNDGARAISATRDKARHPLGHPEPDEGPRGFATIARDTMRNYYESYDRYDFISFPILYNTGVGEETDPTEVIRISPEDATALEGGRLGIRKLAGITFNNFGAFLERSWRKNDILWGRLDGAERIIMTLLRESGCPAEEKEKLIHNAQLAILEEELDASDRDQLLQLLVDAITKADSTDRSEATLRQLTERELGSPVNPKLQAVLRQSLTGEKLLDFFKKSYEVNREPNRTTLLRTLTRSSQVVGKMLEGIAGSGVGSRLAAWVARLGWASWGLVEVSVPESLWYLISRRWLTLLYVFEALLIIGGLFINPQVQLFGLALLLITVVINVGTLVLGDYMRKRRRWKYVLIAVLITVVVLLATLGGYHLWIDYLSDIWQRVSST